MEPAFNFPFVVYGCGGIGTIWPCALPLIIVLQVLLWVTWSSPGVVP